ncbi:hypothetical protein TNCV_2716261 [Trichonephila clavipes]|nr:hypothetical protein TNCV_2716261 [Trichonephila clavipes]
MLAKGERAYSLVDERQGGKRRLRQGEKLNFRCRKARETRPLYVEAEPELMPSSQGRSYPILKTGCFLLDTHHRDVSAFSRIALHATFSIKLLFIPLISLLVSVAYITHVLTYWGSYGIKCVDLESFCTKLY